MHLRFLPFLCLHKKKVAFKMKQNLLAPVLLFFVFCFFYVSLLPPPITTFVEKTDNLGWDPANLLAWQWAMLEGQNPFSDFWYPYFCRIYIETFNLTWVLNIIQIGIIYFCFLLLCDGETLFASLFFWILAAAYFHKFPESWVGSMRYLLSLSCAWLLAVALKDSFKITFLKLFAGFWLGCAFFIEPTQAVAAALCIFPIPFLIMLRNKSELSRLMIISMYVMVGFLLAIAICAGGLAAAGNLYAFWDLVLNLPEHTNGCLFPSNILDWINISNKPENLVLILTMAALFIGVYATVMSFKKPQFIFWILLSTGTLSSLIFYKQLARPHMAHQFLLIPTAGLSLVLCEKICKKMNNCISQQICYVLLGVGLFLFVPFQNVSSKKDLWIREAKLKLMPTAIKLNVEFDHKINEILGTNALREFLLTRSIYVLGDASFWYLQKPQAIPPYITFYNMSPQKCQKQTISWLETQKPEIVLWEPEKDKFDSVPNTVRCPLIFDYIVRNYFVDQTSGSDRFRVLKKRKNIGVSSKTDIDPWLKNLGNQVDYGFIPTAFHSFPPKEDDLQVSVIRITGSGKKDDKLAETTEKAFMLDFGDGKRWEILFRFPSGTESATVRLDRLWFYSFYAAQIDALDFQILAVNNTNLLLEKKRISVDPDSLY